MAVWIGGNDVQPILGGLPAQTSVDVFLKTVEALIAKDFCDFPLFEAPYVGATPLVQQFPPPGFPAPEDFSALAADLNERFFGAEGVINLLSKQVNVTLIETFELMQIALSNPGFFGAALTGPCRITNPATGGIIPLAPGYPTSFWDPLHSTARLHSYVADEVRAVYPAPVPGPATGWLLIVAVGGLAALRRCASSALVCVAKKRMVPAIPSFVAGPIAARNNLEMT